MSMLCPRCRQKARCVDTRPSGDGVRRRYRCPECEARWTTYETIVDGVRPGVPAGKAATQRALQDIGQQPEVVLRAFAALLRSTGKAKRKGKR